MPRLFALPVRLSLLAGLLLVSCGGDDDGSASFAGLAEQRDLQIDTICGCSDELGWPSRSACKNGQDPIGPSKRSCADDALALDVTVAKEYIACYGDLERNYTKCLDDELQCDDGASIEVCNDDYRVGAKDCVELSNRVKNALEDCEVSGNSLEIKHGNETTNPPNQPAGGGCTNTCEDANDGSCDDGAPDADYDICDLGTDCADCGAR
jgi:hypothetical protein